MKFSIALLFQALTLAVLFLFPALGLYWVTGVAVVLALASIVGLLRGYGYYVEAIIEQAHKDTFQPWKWSLLATIGRAINLYIIYFLIVVVGSPLAIILYGASSLIINANLGKAHAFKQRLLRNAYGNVKY